MEDNLFDLNNFELKLQGDSQGLLGRGNQASVYLALNNVNCEYYAIKVIDIDKQRSMFDQIQQIKREIDIHLNLNHPSIIAFYSFHYEENNVFIILEHAENGNLENYLRDNFASMPEETKVNIFVKLCEVIQYIHQKGYVYRDLCASNVLLTAGLEVRLCDFGWSIAQDQPQNDLEWKGDVRYIPPEVFQCKVHAKEVDVWGLGVILYQLFHNTTPFMEDGQEPDLMSIYSKIKNKEI